MKIIIVGCGAIGTTLLSNLSAEGHDIIAIDQDPKVVEEISNVYDVMTICGNGVDNDVLNEANPAENDLFIAVTDSDEMNMLGCFLAKRLGVKHTIARIRNPEYNDQSLNFLTHELEISMAINPDLLAARELFNILKFPSAVKIESFSKGNLEMIEFNLKNNSLLDGVSLVELREKYKSKILVCYVRRGDEIVIPRGDFILKSGDHIGITASSIEITRLFKSLKVLKKQARDIMILGGSRTAYYLAEMLTAIGNNAKIIERNESICSELCEAVQNAVVIHGDGSQQELLLEEGLSSMDAFVALTGTAEQNILVSIYAASQGVSKVIAKVSREELIPMAENLGLDCVVSPQRIVSDVLLRYTRALNNSLGSNIETLYKLCDGRIEIIEFNAKEDSNLTSIPLKNLKIKSNILIAGITRNRKTIIPAGNDIILPGDNVIIIANGHILQDLADILK